MCDNVRRVCTAHSVVCPQCTASAWPREGRSQRGKDARLDAMMSATSSIPVADDKVRLWAERRGKPSAH
jgi:hypothetical protein